MIQNTLFISQNSLFGNQMTQNTLCYGFYVDGQKITTYALGEHDPGSAQEHQAKYGALVEGLLPLIASLNHQEELSLILGTIYLGSVTIMLSPHIGWSFLWSSLLTLSTL